MVMETSGPNVTVVEPGSADDPFTRKAGAAAEPVATPAAFVPASLPNQPVSQPGDQPAPQTKPAAPTAGLSKEEVDKIVADRLKEAQSGWDRRNQLLQDQLKSEKQARIDEARRHTEAVRQAQLEGLPPSERERMQQVWNFEDRQAALQEKENALTDYHKAVEGMRLLQQYSAFGVTEEDLMALSDVDKMEGFCKDKKLEFFENGGSLTPAGATSKNANSQKPGTATPAGADAHYDSGGAPPAPQTNQLLSAAGVETMGANIKNLFASNGVGLE